jgi:arabinofuranosyltransferase
MNASPAVDRALSVPRRSWEEAALRGLPYAIFVLLILIAFPVTPDDAFITLRYAQNILGGHGAVFNPGERVEGYSSPLHLLLSTGLLWAAGPRYVILASKLFGIALGALILVATRRMARRVGLSEREATCAQLLVILNINFELSCVNGLETALFGILLLALCASFMSERDGRAGYASALLLFASVLTRPDAMLLFPILFVLRGYYVRRGDLTRSNLFAWSALFLVPFACFLSLRFCYYGLLLPNTYYAKSGAAIPNAVDGIRYLFRPLSPKSHGLLAGEGPIAKAVLIFAPAAFWGIASLGIIGALSNSLVLGGVLLSAIVFDLKAGGDWMQGWRFLIVVAPIIAIYQCFGVRVLAHVGVSRSENGRNRVKAAAWSALASTWIACLIIAPKSSWPALGFTTDPVALVRASGSGPKGMGRRQAEAALLLAHRFLPHTTVAYSEIGLAGFINMDKRIIDIRGLTDHEVAMLNDGVYKSSVGVTDLRWFDPASPVGRILVKRRPEAILAFEDVPLALDEYVNVASAWGVQVYVRPGVPFLPDDAKGHEQ